MNAQEAIEYIKIVKPHKMLWNPCDVIKFIEQQQQQIEAMKPVVTAAEEFCQTAVYVHPTQATDEFSHRCWTDTDAVSKLRYFVEKWQGAE